MCGFGLGGVRTLMCPCAEHLPRRGALQTDGQLVPPVPLRVRRVEHVCVVVARKLSGVAPEGDKEVAASDGCDRGVVTARCGRAADGVDLDPAQIIRRRGRVLL